LFAHRVWKVAAEDHQSTNTAKPNNDAGWHPITQVVYSKDSKRATVVNLLTQNAELREVIRGSIHVVMKDMVFEDAYPVMQSHTGFARNALLVAACARGASAAEIKRRLKVVDDRGFAEDLASLVRTLSCYGVLCVVDTICKASRSDESISWKLERRCCKNDSSCLRPH
jgi:hypothetical protein